MVFHTHPVGLTTAIGVYILALFADYATVNYVIEYGQHDSTTRMLLASTVHFLLIMLLFCHVRTMISDPGYVPYPTTKIDVTAELEKEKQNNMRDGKRAPPAIEDWTVCAKCETFRPPRSHHCKRCRRCVRRMDHHCPWTNNCIGELNFKYFYLFLVYTGVYCLFILTLVVGDWLLHHDEEYTSTADKTMTILVFFEATIFGMFVSAVAAGQTVAVFCDRNALEVRRYGRPTTWPKTPRCVLIQALCGRGSRLLWLLPCVRARIVEPLPPSSLFKTEQTV